MPGCTSDIRARMAADGIDLLLLDANDDIIYTTGFSHYTTERPVVFAITQDRAFLLVPELERNHALDQAGCGRAGGLFRISRPRPAVQRARARHRRHQGRRRPFGRHFAGARAGRSPRPSPMRGWFRPAIVGQMRLIKRPEELVLHARGRPHLGLHGGCRRRADRAMPCTAMARCRPRSRSKATSSGMRWTPCIASMTNVMLVQGIAGGLVYSGIRSAFPHGMPSGHRPQRGESMILSLGCRVGGRAAESERTFILGEPTKEQERYYTIAQTAQAMGTAGLLAGATCASADDRALGYIRDEGMGEYCLHRVGHGMGVMFHEPPWVEGGDDTVMVAGHGVFVRAGALRAGPGRLPPVGHGAGDRERAGQHDPLSAQARRHRHRLGRRGFDRLYHTKAAAADPDGHRHGGADLRPAAACCRAIRRRCCWARMPRPKPSPACARRWGSTIPGISGSGTISPPCCMATWAARSSRASR